MSYNPDQNASILQPLLCVRLLKCFEKSHNLLLLVIHKKSYNRKQTIYNFKNTSIQKCMSLVSQS